MSENYDLSFNDLSLEVVNFVTRSKKKNSNLNCKLIKFQIKYLKVLEKFSTTLMENLNHLK